jgi:hypothetical protein
VVERSVHIGKAVGSIPAGRTNLNLLSPIALIGKGDFFGHFLFKAYPHIRLNFVFSVLKYKHIKK